ncbi:MAG: PAS domain S-box protein, partial [Holophagaceae bacterium]
MRITARLTLVSACVAGALGVLLPLLAWSFQEFSEARGSFLLAQQIKVGFLERTSFRDQYFLYREARMEAMWEHNRAAAEGLLLQAQAQFRREQEREILARLHRDMDENAAIFRRIVGNSALLEAAEDSRPAYEELHKRLASQLLLKAVAVHDAATALQEASGQRVEQAYRHLVVIVALVALLVAITTLMASTMIIRMIRRRVGPLHQGVRSIAEGNLGHRIGLHGSDEFAELSRDIDAMAGKLESSTLQLGEELSRRLQVTAQQKEEARFRAWFELPLAGICITSPEKGWLAVNDHLCHMLGYEREELQALTWADLTHPEDLTLDLVLFERVLRGESEGYSLEKRFLRKDGTAFLSDLGVGCVRKADGSVDYFVAMIQDITERKAAEVTLQERTLELAERVKELDCLYAVSRVAETCGDNLEALLQATVELLPAAWQHPSLACAQAVVDGQTYTTANYRPCRWRQEQAILVQEMPVGTVEVGYLALPFPEEAATFLPQEGRLLVAVAERLGKAVDRLRGQRVLRSRDELHRMLLHTAMDGFWRVDQQGRLLEVNESY